MAEFEDLHVDYHQMVVTAAGWDDGGIGLYSVGGRLLQLSGRSDATVFTGPYMGAVQVRADGLFGPPTDDAAGWEAVEEVTIWAPAGSITVSG